MVERSDKCTWLLNRADISRVKVRNGVAFNAQWGRFYSCAYEYPTPLPGPEECNASVFVFVWMDDLTFVCTCS